MRVIRIYQPGTYSIGDLVDLSPEASQHLAVVLRCTSGTLVHLFRGDNHEFMGKIHTIQKKIVQVRIEGVQQVDRESPAVIHLAQALSKGDRMEWVIQKAVELGVASITPLITQHCSVKLHNDRLSKKRGQWEQIIIAACEQCGRNRIPLLHPFQNLSEYVQRPLEGLKIVLAPSSEHKPLLSFTEQPIHVVVGAEGGFSTSEMENLKQQDFQPLSLGPRILRTETAAIAAIAAIQSHWGDMQ